MVMGQLVSLWPEELVLSWSPEAILATEMPDFRLLKLVSKTNDTLVFEVQVGHTFESERLFSFFGSPEVLPRTVLEYETM